MQRVELTTYRDPLHCPFCGACVLDDESVEPCVHTLYVATDEGFEHVSDRLGLDPEFELPYDETWDSYTDSLKFPESVKFAIYIPAPSGFGAYVGFAAIRAE